MVTVLFDWTFKSMARFSLLGRSERQVSGQQMGMVKQVLADGRLWRSWRCRTRTPKPAIDGWRLPGSDFHNVGKRWLSYLMDWTDML